MSQQPSPTSSPGPLPKPSSPEVMKKLVEIQSGSVGSNTGLDTPKTRSISFAGPSTSTPPRFDRRTSIQFAPSSERPERPTMMKIAEFATPLLKKGPRNASPPPPSTYHSRVSFDTFNNSSVTDQEFTLVSKHNGYTYGRHQRVFLVAIDQNAYSEHALKWLIEDMVEDGDEVICLRVIEIDPKAKEGATSAQMATYKEDAKKLLTQIQEKNDAADKKAISIIMEFAIGNIEQTILHMINIYSPAFLTVGTRGKSLGGLQGLLPGSVSKWCMQNSPVPVVVVRHPDKRQKKMNKRKNDPERKGYAAILAQSASIPNEPATFKGGKIIEAEAGEAEAVAKALGLTSKIANWKGLGFKKGEGNIAQSVQDEKSDTSKAGRAAEEEGEEDVEEEEAEGEEEDEEVEEEDDDEEEDGEGEDGEDSSDDDSPTGVMYTESGGMETMPNFTGAPVDDLDDDVERLALSDEEDYETLGKARV